MNIHFHVPGIIKRLKGILLDSFIIELYIHVQFTFIIEQ